MTNESLNEFQLSDAEPEDFYSPSFVIEDESKAVWAMRKLAVSQRRIDTVNRQAQDEVARIERWVVQSTRSDRATVDYFSEVLGNYVKRLREDGQKSLSLPDGTVKSREIPEKVKVDDLDVFLKWAEQAGHGYGWVRVKKEADLTAIKAAVTFDGDSVIDSENGVVIAGLSHVPSSVSVTFEVSE